MQRFYFLGDSITELGFACHDDVSSSGASAAGWLAILQSRYARRADIVQRGFSGYNTRWIRQLLCSVPTAEQMKQKPIGDETVLIRSGVMGDGTTPLASAEKGRIDLLTIYLGSNDNARTFQHVPLEEFKANLCSIVAFARQEVGVSRIALVTPGPLCQAKLLAKAAWIQEAKARGEDVQPLRFEEDQAAYAQAVRDVVTQLKNLEKNDNSDTNMVCLVDFETAVVAACGSTTEEKEAAVCDGLHLSGLGNAILAKAWLSAVTLQWPELAPERMSLLLPPFRWLEA